MPRPRAGESCGATFLVIFRFITIFIALAAFACLIWLAIARKITYFATYAAPLLSVGVNLAEIIPLLNRKRSIRRPNPAVAVILDVFIWLFCAGVMIEAVVRTYATNFNDMDFSSSDYPLDKSDYRYTHSSALAFIILLLLAAVGGLHLIFTIVNCVYCCARRRDMRKVEQEPIRMVPSQYQNPPPHFAQTGPRYG
ncbi:hypothetical protein BDZ85DRAFT_1266 [Elsinoe ampelina]|uniref:MARVEL domain-containing protein n=1 Tax=Elsinoe ampelina TaxID=302913 RepID=A0A6A6GNV5_9PEZI|nr:hypothetical protein BDZ85DRAFT_1266 [Elsinoe ampelina]